MQSKTLPKRERKGEWLFLSVFKPYFLMFEYGNILEQTEGTVSCAVYDLQIPSQQLLAFCAQSPGDPRRLSDERKASLSMLALIHSRPAFWKSDMLGSSYSNPTLHQLIFMIFICKQTSLYATLGNILHFEKGNGELSHGKAEDDCFPSPSQTLVESRCFHTFPDCCSPYNRSQVQVSRLGKVPQEGRLLVILY